MREYELLDTGVFDDDRYWIVEVHYAKADPTDILMRVVVRNRGPEEATLHVLPTLWFRNEWSFDPDIDKPTMLAAVDEQRILAKHAILGDYTLEVGDGPDGTVPDPAVLRERNERGSLRGRAADHPVPEGRHQRPRRASDADTVNPELAPGRRPPPGTS